MSRSLCGTHQDSVMYKQAESVCGLYHIGPIPSITKLERLCDDSQTNFQFLIFLNFNRLEFVGNINFHIKRY